MLAHAYRLALLSEFPAAALLALFLFMRGTTGLAASILVALAFPFLVRLVIVAAAFTLGWVHRAPRTGLGLAGALRLLVREWWALVRWSLLDMPFERRRLRPDPPLAPSPRPAILLAHGYGANRGCFRTLVAQLEAAGVGPVHTPNFPSWNVPIERYGEQLAGAVRAIAEGTGRPVVLVGHSMGGLAARHSLAHHGSANVAALVTIASPHHGTALAPMGYGVNARQMRIGSDFLAALASREAQHPARIPITCLMTPHDNLVMPQDTALLEGARAVVVPGEGHLTILESAAAVRAIAAAAG